MDSEEAYAPWFANAYQAGRFSVVGAPANAPLNDLTNAQVSLPGGSRAPIVLLGALVVALTGFAYWTRTISASF